MLIGDVAGKGIRAAGLTETVRSAVRAFSGIDSGPAFILRKTNEFSLRHEPGEPHVTACLCLIDPATGHVSVASAGHPAPVHCRRAPARSWIWPLARPSARFPTTTAPHTSCSRSTTTSCSTRTASPRRATAASCSARSALVEVVEGLRGSSVDAMAQGIADAALAFGDGLRDDLNIVVVRLA